MWFVVELACLRDRRREVEEQIQRHVLPEQDDTRLSPFDLETLVNSPFLNSAFSETLRLRSVGISLRSMARDSKITVNGQTYNLEKGSLVFIPMPVLHKDPELHANPNDYQIDRFLKMHSKNVDTNASENGVVFQKNGAVVHTPITPYGGGIHMVQDCDAWLRV